MSSKYFAEVQARRIINYPEANDSRTQVGAGIQTRASFHSVAVLTKENVVPRPKGGVEMQTQKLTLRHDLTHLSGNNITK